MTVHLARGRLYLQVGGREYHLLGVVGIIMHTWLYQFCVLLWPIIILAASSCTTWLDQFCVLLWPIIILAASSCTTWLYQFCVLLWPIIILTFHETPIAFCW